MKMGTKAVHGTMKRDPLSSAIMPPIYQTSTYLQQAPGEHKGYEYGRTHNPTREAVESTLMTLENGKFGLCFASGMAAIDAIFRLLDPGDHILCTDDVYGGTYRILVQEIQRMGVEVDFVDTQDVKTCEQNMKKNTKMIFIETPSNPLLRIVDIEAVSEIAQSRGIRTVIDNTFATPYLQRPLELGADLVVHSMTKYLGGHSDLVMGCIVGRDEELGETLRTRQNTCGAVPGPQDCFLAFRGIKTLGIRMERHCSNCHRLAHLLQSHPVVDQVNYPGFDDSPNHRVAKRQMSGFGGMLSFSLRDDTISAAFEVMKRFRIFRIAESLGGVESLVGHPATMTHASIPETERKRAGIGDSLIRLSVGIEDPEDLVNDLEVALD